MADADSDAQLVAPQQVVFIDSSVPDIQDLLNGLAPGERAFILDPSSDGLQQIADVLAANGLSNLASISIVGHGSSGAVTLGSTTIDDADLAADSAALAQIGSALAPSGTLQLYACDTAAGATGQQFIADLSQFIGGISVAASSGDVGQTPAGENWDLDTVAGADGLATALPADSATSPFTAAAEANFSGTLATTPDPEVWMTATQGSDENLIIHADEPGNGSGTASNVGTLFTPVSANNPSDDSPHVSSLDLLQLDTQDNVIVIATQGNNGAGEPTRVLIGNLASELANPTATPTYTSLFSESVAGQNITGLALDPDNSEVYFDDGHNFYKVGYGGGSVTTLGSTGSTNSSPFLDGLALDLPHHVAYFASATSSVGTTTTIAGNPAMSMSSQPGAHVHHPLTFASSIYETSTLTNGSSSVTISKLIDIPTTDSTIFDGGGVAGLTVDTTTGAIYFTTKATAGAEGGVWEILNPTAATPTITNIWRQTGAAGTLNSGIVNSITIDHATGEYFVSIENSNGTGGGVYVGELSSHAAPVLFETMPTYNSGAIDPTPNGLALDNAPVLAVTGAGASYTETAGFPSADGTPAALITGATVTDSDNDKSASASVSITTGFDSGVDKLSIAGAASGTVAGTSITFSYNAATGVMSLTGTDTPTHYQTALADVKFVASGDNPTNFGTDTSRTLSYAVDDGLLSSPTVTAMVNVVGVNDPPVLGGAGNSVGYTERAAVATVDSGLTVTDPDNQKITGATATISAGAFSGDELKISGNLSGSIVNGANGTIAYAFSGTVLTLSGSDTLADYQAALRLVTFDSTSHNPTNFGADTSRTISFVGNDGSGSNNLSTAVNSTVNITAVDDAPTLAVTGAGATYTETAGFPSANGTPVTVLTSATPADVDNTTLASASVAITSGYLSGAGGDILSIGGATGGTVAGTNIGIAYSTSTGILMLTGTDTLANYQAALQAVGFVAGGDNPTNFGADTSRTLSFTINDGTLGSTPAATATVSVDGVNDPPVLGGAGNSVGYTERGSVATVDGGLTVTDPDNQKITGATATISAGAFSGDELKISGNLSGSIVNGANGTIAYSFSGTTLTLSGSDTLADYQAALRLVTFDSTSHNPTNAGADTSRTIAFQADDGSASNHASTAVNSTVNITAVDDAPTLSVTGAGATYTETAGFPSANGTPVTVLTSSSAADVDNTMLAGAAVAITTGYRTGASGDLLSIGGASSGTVASTNISFNYSTSTGILTLTGADTLANYQTALQAVGFVAGGDDPTSGGTDTSRTLSFTVNDGTTNSAAATATVTVAGINDPPTLTATGSNPTFTEAAGVGTQASAVTLFSAAAAGTVESGQTIAGLTFTVSGLADGANEKLSVDGTPITLGANASGTTTTNGMSYVVTVSGSTATIALTKAAGISTAALDTLVNALSYQDTNTDNPTAGNRVVTLTQIKDNGGTANGGVDTTTLALASTVKVVATDDPPVNHLPSAQTATEDTPKVISGLSVTDPDAGSQNIQVTLSVAHGILSLNTGVVGGLTASQISGDTTGSVVLTGSQSAIDATLADAAGLTYQGNFHYSGADTLSVTSNDLGNSGSGGPLSTGPSTVGITANAAAASNTLTAFQSTVLKTDVDGDGVADPGDTVTTNVQIANNSTTTAATGVTLNETLTGLTPVAGSLKVTPIAVNDAYSTTGNTALSVSAGSGVLANDVSPDGGVLTATGIVQSDAVTHGTVVMDGNGDGGFTYTPDTGYSGSASFQYTAHDANGGNSNQTGTVTLTVGTPTWYVNGSASAVGADGSAAHPFQTIGAAVSAAAGDSHSGVGDTISVAADAYTGAGITLASGEKLIGAGSGSTTFTVSSGTAVTLNSGNTVSGLAVTESGSGAGITDNGSSVGTLHLSNIAVTTGAGAGISLTHGGTVDSTGTNTISTGTGTALNVTNTNIGAANLTFQSISDSGGTNGIILNNTGSAGGLVVTGIGTTAGSGGTIQNNVQGALFTSTSDLSLSNMNFTNPDSGNGTVNNADNSTFNSAADAGINLSGVSTATFTNLNVNGNGGTGGAQVGINGLNVSNLTIANSTVVGFGDAVQEGDVKLFDLSGNSALTNSTFGFVPGDTSGGENLVDIRNDSGTLNLNVAGSTFHNTADSTNGSDGLQLTSTGNAIFNLNASNNTFTNLKTAGIDTFAEGTSTMNVNITNGNTFTPGTVASRAIGLNAQDTAKLNFNIENNTAIKGYGGPVLEIFSINSAAVQGRIDNNSDIENNGTTNLAGSPIDLDTEDNSTAVFEVSGNTINNAGQDAGISATVSGDGGTTNNKATQDLTLTSNTINLTGKNLNSNVFNNGILLSGGANNNDATALTANLQNNSVSGVTSGDGNAALAIENLGGSSHVYFEGFNTNSATTWNNRGNSPTTGQQANAVVEIDNGIAPAAIPAGHNGGHTKTPANAAPITPGLSTPTIGGTAQEGQTLTASASDTGGGTITYQWQENFGSGYGNIAGATSSQYSLAESDIGATLDVIATTTESDGGTASATSLATAAVTDHLTLTTPTISGSAQQGQVLTATTPTTDNPDATITYQWEANHGSGFSVITGATGQNYRPVTGDVGATLEVIASATDPHGGSISATSGATVTIVAPSSSPISIGTLGAGESVTASFDSTVNTQTNQLIVNASDQGTVTSSFPTATTDLSVTTVDSLALGNLVFDDVNDNGVFDAGDSGVSGVALTLYADTNADGTLDAGDTQLATTTTTSGGAYSFTGLAPGSYIVRVDQSNFNVGGVLAGLSPTAADTTPNDNTDNDSNGVAISGNGVASHAITLSYNNEPTAGTGNDTNNTLDFGFASVPLNHAPSGTSNAVTTLEDTAYVFGVADFGFTDPNDSPPNSLLAVEITTTPGAGSLTDNGVPVTAGQFVPVADITGGLLDFAPAANANGAGYASFTFQVEDNGGTANGGVNTDPTPKTLTVNVTSVNDAPSGTDNTIVTNENGSSTLTVADFGFTDPNDSPPNSLLAVKITTTPGAGSLTDNGAAVTAGQFVPVADITGGLLDFAPAANANGTGYASFTFQVQDNGGTANGGVDTDPTPNTITFNVTPVNGVTLLDASNNVVNTFGTIQEAVNAAAGSNGDTIQVAAGTYQEQVTVDGAQVQNLTIVGAGQGQTTILSPAAANLVANLQNPDENHSDQQALVGLKNNANVTIKDLTIDGDNQGIVYATFPPNGGDLVGIEALSSTLDVSDVHVTGTEDVELNNGVETLQGGQGNSGIIVDDRDASAQTFTITGSTVDNFQRDGILMEGTGLTVDVSDNTVTGVGAGAAKLSQNLIEIDSGTTGLIANNVVNGINVGGPNDLSSADAGLGILAFNAGSGLTVSGNTVSASSPNANSLGIFFAGVDGPTAENNTIANQGVALVDDGGSPQFLGFSDPFATALTQDGNTFTGDGQNYFFFPGPMTTQAWTVTGTGGPDDLEGGAEDDIFTISGSGPTGSAFVGNAGIDTVESYGADSSLAINNNQWTVTNGTTTDTLTGIEKVVINGQTYDLVDNFGQDSGGFQTVQAAINAALTGETIAVDAGNAIIYFDRTANATDADTLIAGAGAGPIQLRIAPPIGDSDNNPLTITLTGVPTYGTVSYFNGTNLVPVTTGATLTATQLANLEYTPPTTGEFGGGAITYTVADGGNSAQGTVAVSVVADSSGPTNLYFSAFAGPNMNGNPVLSTLDSNGNPVAIESNGSDVSDAGEDGGFFRYANELYFFGSTPATGDALYELSSNGTVAPVSDGASGFFGDSEENAHFTEYNGSLYFEALSNNPQDPTNSGDQLVKLNADGTSQTIVLNPGGQESFAGQNGGFTEFDGSLYFSAFTPTSGSNNPDLIELDANGNLTEISTNPNNGSSAGEEGGFYVFNNALYFNATSASLGDTLFRLDAGSTTPVAVDPTGGLAISFDADANSAFHEFDGSLYFNEFSNTTGQETLFKLDTHGTLTALTYNNGTTDEALQDAGALGGFTDFAGSTYFIATTQGEGTQLFKLDTGGNITQVTTTLGGTFDDNQFSQIVQFAGSLYFDGIDGSGFDSLFKLDADGTLSSVAGGTLGAAGVNGGFQVFDGSLYFYAQTPSSLHPQLIKLDVDPTTGIPSFQASDYNLGNSPILFPTSPTDFGIFPALTGTPGNDIIVGSASGETLNGLTGDDVLDGRGGNDTLTGGDGADIFQFETAGTANVDTVTDYSFTQGDTLDVSALVDADFTVGSQVGDFVRLVASGNDLILQVDPDGPANGHVWQNVAILQNANIPAGTTGSPHQVTAYFGSADHTITQTTAPLVVAEMGSVLAGQSVTANAANGALAGDSDPSGFTLSITSVTSGATTDPIASSGSATIAGSYGHLTLNSDGSYSYVADNGLAIVTAANGSPITDTFAFTVSDGHGGSTASSLTETISLAAGGTETVTNPTGAATYSIGATTLTLDETSPGTFAGKIQDGSSGNASGLVIVNGAGPLTLTGTNTYTGITRIIGTLAVSGAGSIADSSKVNLFAAGAVLDVSGAASTVSINKLVGAAGTTVDLGAAGLSVDEIAGPGFAAPGIFAGTIQDGSNGSGGILIVNGAGPLTFTGANTYTGITRIIGTLAVSGAGSIADSSKVNLFAAGAVLDVSGAASTVSINKLVGAAGTTVDLGAAGLSVDEIAGPGFAAPGIFAGTIQDGSNGSGGILIVNGAGPLTFTGANTYTGITRIIGTLAVSGAGSIADSNKVNLFAAGAVLDVSGAASTVSINKLVGAAGTTVDLGAAGLSVDEIAGPGFAAPGIFAGTIQDGSNGSGGIFIVNGAGPLTFTGTNTYTGITRIIGTLAVSGAGSIADSSKVNLFAAGAVLDISGAASTVTINKLVGAAGTTVDLGAAGLSVDEIAGPGFAAPGIFAGTIQDGSNGSGGIFIVNGAGPLTLTGTNTYTGGTVLTSGTLDLDALGAAGSGTITFTGAATLEIDAAALTGSGPNYTFGNTIAGTTSINQVIDLRSLAYVQDSTSAAIDDGTLTVTDGASNVALTLAGVANGANFTTQSDGHGGTEVYDPPATASPNGTTDPGVQNVAADSAGSFGSGPGGGDGPAGNAHQAFVFSPGFSQDMAHNFDPYRPWTNDAMAPAPAAEQQSFAALLHDTSYAGDAPPPSTVVDNPLVPQNLAASRLQSPPADFRFA